MTPEEKANELIDRFFHSDDKTNIHDGWVCPKIANQCAIICVEEIISELPDTICGYMPEGGTAMEIDNYRKHFWNEVLTHLKNKK